MWQFAIMWPDSPHLKHLGQLVAAPRLGGLVVSEALFGFVDWVVFRGVNGQLYQVVLPHVPRPNKPMDPLAVVFSNRMAL
jgi:hypothetical protein